MSVNKPNSNNKGKKAVETKITPANFKNIDKNTINKTIEAKSNEAANSKKTRKRSVILAIVFTAISIVLIALTAVYVLRIQWGAFFAALSHSFERKIGYFWLFMLLLLGFITVLRVFITFVPRIKSYGCHISFGEYLILGITCSFLSAVTPLNLVSDPYAVFWMKTHGIPTSKCASLMFSTGFLYQISQFIITLPAFIICCINRYYLFKTPEQIAVFVFICIGAIFDVCNFLFTLSICVWKQLHYLLARMFNWIKKILRMQYHTKAETEQKYKRNAVIRSDFIAYMKDWKNTVLIVVLFLVGDIIGTMSLSWGMYFVQYTSIFNSKTHVYDTVKVGFNFMSMFLCARLSALANRINLIPGQQLGYEWTIKNLCMSLGGWNPIPGTGEIYTSGAVDNARLLVTTNGTMVVRIFGSFLPAIAGIGGFIALTVRQFNAAKKGKLIKSIY